MSRYYWAPWQAGSRPPHNAVQGGRDIDGTPIYVGRAHYQGDLLPAKAMPGKSVAYVSYGGNEITLSYCELLCTHYGCHLRWVHSSGGNIPFDAVPIGRTSTGETLYVGRVHHQGSQCVGKLHPSHRTCYIPFGGAEHSYTYYEVLVGN